MNSDQKNIHQLIAYKLQELNTLKEEWKGATRYSGDMDYEYLALLYPIIAETEREISKFMKLATNEYAGELHFPAYIRQLLSNECYRLEIHIDMGRHAYVDFKGPLMVFERMKQKYAVSVKLLQLETLEAYIHEYYLKQLQKMGWKRNGKNVCRLKHVVRNDDDLNDFHRLIACTFMEPLAYLMQQAKEQHLIVIPSPVS
ncbi:hypothetical protein L3C95_30015 [Chitinophaga filiformis]|uniref:hypothetical protein n=1 Tax=Chitinophaga filiformis TaxID=104663 RepID=UPI001F3418F5|nr:hypothetical protein [Chitinophaga filiformis]MCF6407170.1 hypothetical protein [Chitinophaga filiformis]